VGSTERLWLGRQRAALHAGPCRPPRPLPCTAGTGWRCKPLIAAAPADPCSLSPPSVTTTSTNATFQLLTCPKTRPEQQKQCNKLRGHLTAYTIISEQQEVEKFYVEGGFLYPEFNVLYWFGLLTTPATWPSFRWQDKQFPAPNATSYRNWGTLKVLMEDGTLAYPEPNKYESPLEFCSGANASQARVNAWGWADVKCDLNFTAICRIAKKGACSLPPYTDKKSGASYLYSSEELIQSDAEFWCNDRGGHLVSYESLEEQKAVEGYFMDAGCLIPADGSAYWIGAAVDQTFTWKWAAAAAAAADSWLPQPAPVCLGVPLNAARRGSIAFVALGKLLHHGRRSPSRRWIDRTPDPTTDTYLHWGVSVPDGTPEPNNLYPPEACSTANYTESFGGAWGWADLGCYNNVSIMCKIKRGWRGSLASASQR
jgi:hypothetical protein